MLDTPKSCPLFSRLLIFLLPGLLALGTGWSLLPTLRAQSSPLQVCPPRAILFVADKRRPPNEDRPLVDYLTGLGHQVDVHAARSVQASDAQSKDLVIISESSLSSDINTRLRDLPVPILTWDGWLLDDLQMTGPQEYVDYGDLFTTTITLLDPQHPLAGGLSGQVQTTREIDEFHWGVPGPQAGVVATTQQPSRVYIFAYEAGVPMVGLTAPARRVFIPNATGPKLTANGWTLFDAAVRWTSNCTAGETPTSTATDTPTPPYTPTPTATDTPTTLPTEANQVPLTATPPVEPTATATPPPATMTPTDSPGPSATSTSTPTATPTIIPSAPPPAPSGHLSITKRDFLFTDADNDNLVSPGDTLYYAITVLNDGAGMAPLLRLADQPDSNTTLVTGSVKAIGGVIVQGNHSGDNQVLVEITPLISGAYASLSLQVVVNSQISVTQLQNQALVTIINPDGQPSGQAPFASDDPDTAALDDVTITPLTDPVGELIPSLFLPLIHKAQP